LPNRERAAILPIIMISTLSNGQRLTATAATLRLDGHDWCAGRCSCG